MCAECGQLVGRVEGDCAGGGGGENELEILGWKGIFAHAHSQLIVIRHWDVGRNHLRNLLFRRQANAERFHQLVELWLWLLPLLLLPVEILLCPAACMLLHGLALQFLQGITINV